MSKTYWFVLNSVSVSGNVDSIFLSEEFISSKMNTIFKKLIGFPEDDTSSLTTHTPSKDKACRYTILKDLNINKPQMLALIDFLRTGCLSKENIPLAQETAITLGGFDCLDQYIIDRQQIHEKNSQKYLPVCPEEDVNHRYVWTLVNLRGYPLQEEKRLEYCVKGWSASGKTVTITNDNKEEAFMYYKKMREDT